MLRGFVPLLNPHLIVMKDVAHRPTPGFVRGTYPAISR